MCVCGVRERERGRSDAAVDESRCVRVSSFDANVQQLLLLIHLNDFTRTSASSVAGISFEPFSPSNEAGSTRRLLMQQQQLMMITRMQVFLDDNSKRNEMQQRNNELNPRMRARA